VNGLVLRGNYQKQVQRGFLDDWKGLRSIEV